MDTGEQGGRQLACAGFPPGPGTWAGSALKRFSTRRALLGCQPKRALLAELSSSL